MSSVLHLKLRISVVNLFDLNYRNICSNFSFSKVNGKYENKKLKNKLRQIHAAMY